MLYIEIHLKYKDTERLKVKRQKKNIPRKYNPPKTGATILVSGKVHFKINTIRHNMVTTL